MQLREFTPEQLKQAGETGMVPPAVRRSLVISHSYPIDNKSPHTHSDRDDAFHVERLPDGGYNVHIHIADVAAHIPKDSPLDLGALERAFTRYRPEVRDPMFPLELSEGRMSLEDKAERLTLVTIIRLNAAFRPVGMTFARGLLVAQAHDYEMASGRIHTPGDVFELMGGVARGILNPKRMLASYDEKTGTRIDTEGRISFVNPAHLPVTRMVETYMVLANRMVAEFAHASGLPFLYRNHGAAVKGHDPDFIVHNVRELFAEDANLTDKDRHKELRRIRKLLEVRRAKYDPEMKGHLALDLSEGYTHFTSPIRRYADLVNQRVIHYAIVQVERIERALPRPVSETTRRILWEHAPYILKAVDEAQRSGKRRLQGKVHALQHEVAYALEEALPARVLTKKQLRQLSEKIAGALLPHAPPYSRKELRAIASHLNRAANTERAALAQVAEDRLAQWMDKIFPNTNPQKLAAFTPSYFSNILQETAQKGYMNEVFFHEVLRRFDDQKLQVPYDMYSILMEGRAQDSDLWRALKKRSLAELQKDGMAQVSHVFSTARNRGVIPEETDIVEGMMQHRDTGEALHAARVVMEYQGRAWSAPHYSLSYTDKGARKRAIYDFIACFTFGELVPMEEAVLPSRFYADLESHKSPVVLERIARETGMEIETSHTSSRGQSYYTYTVRGGPLSEPISVSTLADTVEKAQRKAARAILRDPGFKRAAAQHDPVAVDFGRKPENVLQTIVRKHKLPMPEIEVHDFSDLAGQRRFEALLMMELPGQQPFIVSHDSAIKRLAERQCCRDAVAILRSMGYAERDAVPAASSRKRNTLPPL